RQRVDNRYRAARGVDGRAEESKRGRHHEPCPGRHDVHEVAIRNLALEDALRLVEENAFVVQSKRPGPEPEIDDGPEHQAQRPAEVGAINETTAPRLARSSTIDRRSSPGRPPRHVESEYASAPTFHNPMRPPGGVRRRPPSPVADHPTRAAGRGVSPRLAEAR